MAAASRILVGISQRAVALPARAERRDTLDQAWAPFLDACGLDGVPVPNRHPDAAGFLRRLGVKGVILSGGGNLSDALGTLAGAPARVLANQGDLSPERDRTETALLRASLEQGWPVLGVCRGMQVLNLFHGGHLGPLEGHAGKKHVLTSSKDAGFVFDAQVNSFHDCGVPADGLGKGLRSLATADGHVEALAHETLPHLGVMWHPERNSPFSASDVALFRRFFHGEAA
jgi:gamma-glutamyl-gamma-aminobutyrate hydrolase PuuD